MRNHRPAIDSALEADDLFREVARAAGRPAETFVYGDWVLEAAAGRQPGGMLVATTTDPATLAGSLARSTGRAVVVPGHREGVFNLASPGRRNLTVLALDRDIRTHLSDSGFTVQAMAVDACSRPPRELIDPFGGLADLDSGVLRRVTPAAFTDDPARLLTAVELCARYNLEPESGTGAAMREAAALIGRVGPSRLWRLIAGLFGGRGLSEKARLLERSGVMAELLPEVARTFDVPQNYYHHLGVWEHTLETLDILEAMMDEPARFFPAFGGRILAHLNGGLEGGIDRRSYLGFAALVHDVGKPASMSVQPSGRIRFQGHQEVGGKLAQGIALRMGLGRRGTGHLRGIVSDHMRLGFLLKEGESVETRLRAVRELGDRCIEVVMLSLADRLATRGEASTEEAMERYRRMATRVMHDYFWDLDYPELVGGRDVLLHLGLTPGPEVGRALFRVRVAQREALVSSRRQALEFLAPDFKGRMRPGV